MKSFDALIQSWSSYLNNPSLLPYQAKFDINSMYGHTLSYPSNVWAQRVTVRESWVNRKVWAYRVESTDHDHDKVAWLKATISRKHWRKVGHDFYFKEGTVATLFTLRW